MYLLKIYIVQFGIHFFLVCVQKSLYNYDKFHGSLYIHNVNEYHGLLRFVTLKQGTAPCLLDFRCSTCMNVANSATTLLSIEADIPQSLIDCSSYNVTKLQNKNSTQITHFKLQLSYSSFFHPHAIMQSQFLFIHQDHLNSLTLELVTRLCHLVFHL